MEAKILKLFCTKFLTATILFFFSGTFAYSLSFNEPLDVKDAYKFSVKQTNNQDIQINIQIDKTAYLYANSLDLFVSSAPSNNANSLNVSHLSSFPKGVKYHGFVVLFDKATFKINAKDIQKAIGSDDFSLIIKYQGCSKGGFCYPPIRKNVKYANNKLQIKNTNSNKPSFMQAPTNTQKQKSESEAISDTLANSNLAIILLTFFGFGLLLSLTPCIFPMIPIISSILVSYSKEQGNLSIKKSFAISLVYVLSMSVAYSIAGVLAGMFGANIQAYLQNPWVISIFAGVFVLLAFSMFGAFKLQMPAFIQNKLHTKEANSLLGVAIMGFFSALIVGPCVAPPLAGALIYIGQSGDFVLGGLALFVMSIGLGVPMLIIGLGAGKYMPKPGMWMNLVSQLFGIAMLVFAIYMLERIISDTICLILLLIVFGVYGAYLLKQSQTLLKRVSIIFFALAFGMLYIIASTTLLTSQEQEGKLTFSKIASLQELNAILEQNKNAKNPKPIMVDFSADWCVSCKELEDITFKDERVIKLLQDYKLIKIDTTKNTPQDKELYKHFNIFGPPALIFFDTNSKEIRQHRIVGFKNADDFLNFISK